MVHQDARYADAVPREKIGSARVTRRKRPPHHPPRRSTKNFRAIVPKSIPGTLELPFALTRRVITLTRKDNRTLPLLNPPKSERPPWARDPRNPRLTSVFRYDDRAISFETAVQEIAGLLDEAIEAPKRTMTVEVPELERGFSKLSWAEAVALSHLVFSTQNPIEGVYATPDDSEE